MKTLLAEIEDSYPLSPLQEGMLFHTLRDAGVGMYIQQAASRMDGLDSEALRRAWQQVVDRHPILRTGFDWTDPEHPIQQVHRHAEVPFSVLDWREYSPGEQRALLTQLLERERETAFGLDSPPLIRIIACRISLSRWQVVNTHHHLILDGWSGGVIAGEVAKLYEAECLGEPLELPEPIGYRRYIEWLSEQDLCQAERFWRQKLTGIDGPTTLPADRWLDATGSGPSPPGSWTIDLEGGLCDALEALARNTRVTISTLVQGAWGLLLSRYSGCRTVLFGVLVSGRPPNLEGVESIVGMFLNTVPFRVDVEPSQPVDRWLGDLREQQVELQQYEYSPLLRVQQWSDFTGGQPLFDSIVARKDTTGARREGRSRGSRRERAQTTFQQNYALLLNLRARDGIELKLTYDTTRFDAQDVVRFMHQLSCILKAMVVDPTQPLASIQLMDEAERDRVLSEWNPKRHELPERSLLSELVEQQARDTPDGPAVVGTQGRFSYSELIQEADRIAWSCSRCGVPAGALVALDLPREPVLVAAMVAVLKVGALFMVVDSRWEQDRRRQVLDATHPYAILRLKDQWVAPAAGDPWQVIAIESAGSAPSPPHPALDAVIDAPACVVHGEGPGATAVAIPRRAIHSRLLSEPVPLQPGECSTLLSHMGGLGTVLEAFSAITTGALLALGLDGAQVPGSESLELLRATAASRTALSQAGLRRLLAANDALESELPDLRHLVCRHRGLDPDLVREAMRRLPQAEITAYFHASVHGDALGRDLRDHPDDERVLLGRPLSNSAIYILDSADNLCPIGVPGELHVAGDGLASGDWPGNPETPESFLSDHLGADCGRLLRTGLLARWLPDGQVESFGSLEEQYSIAGRRFSPVLVESRLRQHAHVRDVVVTLADNGGLIAHVVTDGTEAPADDLRRLLAGQLPSALIPRLFHRLEAMPLAAEGGVDRHALEAWRPADRGIGGPQKPGRALEGELELQVALAWRKVLGVEEITADSNFFELGGHSLSATQATVSLSQMVGWSIPLRGIFEAPTVSGFTAWIEANRDCGQDQTPALRQSGRDETQASEAPQSFAQQRLWFLSQLAPGSALYNLPGGIQLSGDYDADALRLAVSELVCRHESLRTTFDNRNGEPVQVISAPAPVELPTSDLRSWQRERRHQELARLRRALNSKSFNLTRGPLLRLRIVLLTGQRQVLLFCMHHIITDGWSLNVMRRELISLYQAFRAGKSSPLAPIELQYADFALWQRDWLQGDRIHDQLDYWRGQLTDLARLDLPTDRPRPAVPRYVSAQQVFALDPDLGRRLHALARQEESTLFMLVLAAFSFLLGHYSGLDDVAVGTPIANRSRPELEGLIGFFVNTLVMRTDLSGRPSFRDLLRRVRRVCLDAYANQDLPFERLVEELAPERDISVQPLFQVLFVLQNTPASAEESQPRRSEPTRTGNPEVAGLIYYDLTLSLRETGQGISGALHYNTDLFDPATAERMVGQLLSLLGAVNGHPDAVLTADLMITAEERLHLLHDLQGETMPIPPLCIHQLFEETVDRHPSKAALVFEGESLAFQELDARANGMAHTLIALGVSTDRVVGVFLERGPMVIVALLGILKAGGAYLPLDPGLPPDRLVTVLGDARPAAIVTSEALVAALPPGQDDLDVLVLSETPEQPESSCRPAMPSSPRQLAYVIFTSGSTGKPKGVAVEHRSLCNTVLGQIPQFGITVRSRVLSTIAFSFDASLGEIFRTLIAGGTLFLTRAEDLLPGPGLDHTLRDLRITTVTMVPSVLRAMPRDTQLPALETISVGGEALITELADEWRGRHRLINGYGPTETAVGATLAVDWEAGRRPPIGRPLPNVRLYVVARDGTLLPLGIPGELYIGGPGVARGYLDRPELTSVHFARDLFSDDAGGRVYCTGDRVRWTAEGQLAFLGRMDDQVKLRGYRIEPGEIAAVLRKSDAITDAVVMVRGREAAVQRLVAYAVPTHGVDSAGGAAADLVDEWNQASEMAAAEVMTRTVDPRLNFAGWTSRYDGQPIPVEEMREWADNTVALIRDLGPREVLEIGSGTGLILFRLAPHCRRYVGVDFAQGLLDQAANHLSNLKGSGCEVALMQRRADALDDLPDAGFDCVVLNSVAQYFPDLDYLLRVLQGAVRLVRAGGKVFLGDVRNLRVLEALHASIQLHRSGATASVSGLTARVERHMELERELVVDPGLFARLQEQWPRVSHIQVMPRHWQAGNELVRYRFDVVMHVEGEAPRVPQCDWIDWQWQEETAGLAALRMLLEKGPSRLGFRGIPNSRIQEDAKIMKLLRTDPHPDTVLEVRQAIATGPSGIEPQAFVELAAEFGYRCELSWLNCDAEGRFDALLDRDKDIGPWRFPMATGARYFREREANNPAQMAGLKHLQAQLRDWLGERLPEYMVPSDFVILNAMPLTAHGKVDRRRLPDPTARGESSGSRSAYEAPRSQVEIDLAGIWADLLRLPRVGIHDNFFDLGGDSILSIQMIARAGQVGIQLTPKDVYQRQTIAEQAELADRDKMATAEGQMH